MIYAISSFLTFGSRLGIKRLRKPFYFAIG
nr:MAG TPA: hypothetical protein [Caudoviricetes sp.]